MPPPLHAKSKVRPAPHPVRLEPDHLPPGEGIPQKGRHTSATSNRTPPPAPSVPPPPTRREAASRRRCGGFLLSHQKTAPFFPERCCFHNIFSYFAGEVDRRVTSWYPPSTMEVEDTRVSLASRCRSGIFVTPQLHMVLLTLYRLASTLSCREPA